MTTKATKLVSLLAPLLVLIVSSGLAFAASSASANEPWYHVESGARPTYLPPEGKGEIIVTVANLGNANTSGAVTIADALPAGLKAISMKAETVSIGGGLFEGNELECPSSAQLRKGASTECVLEGFTAPGLSGQVVPKSLPAFENIELRIGVEVTEAAGTCEPGAATCGHNVVTVSGGGAPTAQISRPVTISEKQVPFGVESYEVMPEEEGGAPTTQAGKHPFQVTGTLTVNQTAATGSGKTQDEYDVHPAALVKDLAGLLPPGLIGNPTPFPQCPLAQFPAQDCPQQTVVGAAIVTVYEPKTTDLTTFDVPIVNLEPAHGEPARFGFFTVVPTILDARVRSGGDYGITLGSSDIPQAVSFLSYHLTFWGVPGASTHDPTRGYGCLEEAHGVPAETIAEKGDAACEPVTEASPPPFLAMPTACPVKENPVTHQSEPEPLYSSTEADSWVQAKPEGQRPVFGETTAMPVMQDCSQLPFEPSLKVTPDGNAASTPTGLTVDVHVPQASILNASTRAQSALRDTTVVLPPGVALNPSDAGGLESCSEGLVGFEGAKKFVTSPGLGLFGFSPYKPESTAALEAISAGSAPAGEATLQPGVNFCSTASKVGTVKIKTPLLPAGQPLEGAIYLATQEANPFSSLLAMYFVAEDPISGSLVKIPAEVTLCKGAGEDPLDATGQPIPGVICQALGQIVATVQNTPQVAFEDFEAHFFGGERAPLATPARCGAYTTTAAFEPWAAEPWDEAEEMAHTSSTFDVTSGPNHSACPGASLPFNPTATGGATNIQAGAFSPFTATFSRQDGEQNMQSIVAKLPAGLSGILANVELCPEPQANLGTCGENSLIGETTVSVGVGGQPYSVRGGKFYLTGPYNGTGACTVGTSGCAPFGITFVVPAKAGPFDLAKTQANHPACDCVLVRGKIEIDPYTSAITITSNPSGTPDAIPTSIEGIPLEIQHVNATTTRGAFQFNPTNCAKMEVTGTIHSSEGGSDGLGVPFQVTNCAALKFEPKFSVSTSGKTSKANGASLTAKVTYPNVPQGTDSDIGYVKVELPKALPSRLTTLQKACTNAQFEANPAGCPSPSVIGHATVHTPVVPVPLEGPVYFVSHGGEAFPSLEVVLQGYGLKVILVGTTFISKSGITSTTFKTVPDQPFSSFEITLPEGPYSALAANGNLCALTTTKTVSKKVKVKVHGKTKTVTRKVKESVAASLAMPNEFVGQNGAPIPQTTTIKVEGCPKTKTDKKASKKKKGKAHKGGKQKK
jgi:uncharacterized repeat protein (TIGR01451 family)